MVQRRIDINTSTKLELFLRKGSEVVGPICLNYIKDVRKSVLITWLRLLGRTEVKLKLIEQTAGTFGKV